jgi:hypothetical protein
MDEDDIQDELIKIYDIHESFTTGNPLTFVLFLEENRNKLTEEQIEWVNKRIKKLIHVQKEINKKILEKIDNEISREPANMKYDESKNYFKQIQ